MNKGNASGFLLFGMVMWILPDVAPAMFPRNGLDGSSTRALWLQAMSVVHLAVGAGFLMHLGVWPRVLKWLSTQPAPEPVWTRDPVPAGAVALGLQAATRSMSKQGSLLGGRRLSTSPTLDRQGFSSNLPRPSGAAICVW